MSIDLSGFSAGWTFLGKSGLSTLGSAWSAISPLPSASIYALLMGSGSSIDQSFTTANTGTHTIKFYVNNFWWPTGTQTFNVLIDGTVVYSVTGIDPNRWVQRTFTTTLTAGTHSIKFLSTNPGANETGFIDSVTITDPASNPITLANANFDSYTTLAAGTLVYNPPAVATATFRLAASVTTCGKLLYCKLVKISDGTAVTPGQLNEAPILYLNGVNRGAIRTDGILTTTAHKSWLVPFPDGVTAAASDAVTLSASEGWIFGPAGYAEAMTAQAVTNRVGQSFVRIVDVPRTMALGASYAHHVTAEWHPGFLPKNQRYRCAYWVPANASQDAGGKPLVMGGTSASAPVVNVSASSNIDSTSYPTPTGYWAVRWDDLDGGTSFSLVNPGDPNTSISEVVALANPGVGGVGKVRVFNVQATGSAVNLQVWLRIAKADRNPHFDNLAILAPGDFTWAANTPTVIPMPAWSDVAACVEAKLPPSLPFGPHRMPTAGIVLGESAACEREHVVEPGDFHWAQDVKTGNQVRYIQARPWTNAASPYIYDPLAGTDYPASLTAPITTTPAAGTVETITLAQVGDGLILTGLVLTIDAEKMRVMDPPTGPTTALVTSVMRGVASTTPAQHLLSPPAVKAISVSARRPMASLAAFGPSNQQITELVTQSPHRLKSGQIVPMQGDAWMPFIYSDGRGFSGTWFNPYNMPVYVTGASTFVTIQNGPAPSNPSNTTLSTTYTLTPGPAQHECSSLLYLPEYGGIPYEIAATTAAKHPGVPAWVTFCMVASDDMVDSIWRDRILPNLPPDRDAWTELGDEPWNFAGSPAQYWYGMSYQLYGSYTSTYWYGVRVAQIRDRGRAIWAAAGRDPSRVKCSINVQDVPGIGSSIGGLLDFLASKSALPDAVAIAPYYGLYPDPAIWKAWAAWSTDMLVDAWIWDYYDNASAGAQLHRVGDFKAGVDAWNSAHAGNVGLAIYEYGIDKPWPVYQASLGAAMDASTTTLMLPNATARTPNDDAADDCAKIQPGTWLLCGTEWMTVVSRSGATCTVNRGQGGTTAASHSSGDGLRNDWLEGTRDVTLHPNYRIAHFDALAFLQAHGVSLCIPSSLDQEWSGGNAWSDYHGIAQPPGMGDGSDGKANNLLCLARRGQANSKTAAVSQDANTVSVRGQAMIDWANSGSPSGRPRRKVRFVARPRSWNSMAR